MSLCVGVNTAGLAAGAVGSACLSRLGGCHAAAGVRDSRTYAGTMVRMREELERPFDTEREPAAEGARPEQCDEAVRSARLSSARVWHAPAPR